MKVVRYDATIVATLLCVMFPLTLRGQDMTQHQVRHRPEVSVETNTVYFSVVKEDGPQPVRERLDEGLAREGPEQLTNADDAPAAHQPGSTSHSKGFAEKGADASGAEPTKEACHRGRYKCR